MTNLLEIFEIARDYSEDRVLDTKLFFSKPIKRKKAFSDVLEAIDKNYRWFEILFQDSTHELINGEHSINFLHLVNSMESYELQSIYLNVKLIRQELLVAATKEEFEEMKELHAFWENMEAPLLRLLKN